MINLKKYYQIDITDSYLDIKFNINKKNTNVHFKSIEKVYFFGII